MKKNLHQKIVVIDIKNIDIKNVQSMKSYYLKKNKSSEVDELKEKVAKNVEKQKY